MDTQTIIRERLRVAPKEMRDFLQSDTLDTQIRLISEEYNLSPEQETAFENATALALLGMMDDADYQTMLREGIGITETTAAAIAETADENIFSRVAEPLARLGESEQAFETPAPMAADAPLSSNTVVENRQEREMRLGDMARNEHKRPVKEYAVDPYREPVD